MRYSTFEREGDLRVSKYLQSQILISSKEIEALFETLGSFKIFLAGSIEEKGKGNISKGQFLNCYSDYVDALQKGEIPDTVHYRKLFSGIFTTSLETLYAIEMDGGRELIRTIRPVVQLQAHSLGYSLREGKFRPMVLGKESILWGIQFSYPQIFQDSKTDEIKKVMVEEEFSNTKLFKKLQSWIRHYTRATPFLVKGSKINASMRLGKDCFSWINDHPQLVRKQISVEVT